MTVHTRALALAAGAAVAICLNAGGSPGASAAASTVRLVGVGQFDQPVFVTAPPGDARRVFVVEQAGRIRIVQGGKAIRRPFLDIHSRVKLRGEQGLLSMAFAPDYATTGRFYVNYTDRRGVQRVVEYRRSATDGNRARGNSARNVLSYDGLEPNHNGGLLIFGPDGLMYVGTGDGGGANDQHGRRGNAQALDSLLGKILRIDPRSNGHRAYTSPADNPFVGRRGARPEIYSYGLRNPWRFSFDRSTGDLAIGDVGQSAVEEIDFVRRDAAGGANFGWRAFEGRQRNFPETAAGHVPPVLELTHANGNCSVTGGYVVRDPALPALVGRYVYGDFCRGQLRSVKLAPGMATGDAALGLRRVGQLASFGEDGRGRIYAVSLAGSVFRLAAG